MDRKTQLKKLRKITDDQIDFSDLPDIEDGLEWKPNSFFKPIKEQVTAKLDKDVVMWLKLHGSVTKFLNKICREKMIEERQSGGMPSLA